MGSFWSGRAGLGVEALARARLFPGMGVGVGVGEERRRWEEPERRGDGSAGPERRSAGNLQPTIRHHGQLSHQGQDPRTLARMPNWMPGCPEAVQKALAYVPSVSCSSFAHHSPPERST